jgi:hypothetical protein
MVYDSTTVKRLGVKVDASGIVSVEGSEDIYGDDNLPRIHLEAWTAELEREWKQQEEAAKIAEAAARAAAAPPLPSFEEEPEEEAQAPETRIKLILKTRGKPDFKIVVKPVRLLSQCHGISLTQYVGHHDRTPYCSLQGKICGRWR